MFTGDGKKKTKKRDHNWGERINVYYFNKLVFQLVSQTYVRLNVYFYVYVYVYLYIDIDMDN